MSVFNGFLSRCQECKEMVSDLNVGDCLRGEELHGACRFICPSCGKYGLSKPFFCGFSSEHLRSFTAESESPVYWHETMQDPIKSLLGDFLLSCSSFERMVRDVAAIHDRKLWIERGAKKDWIEKPGVVLRKFQKICLEGDKSREAARQILGLYEPIEENRAAIVHGTLSYILEDEDDIWIRESRGERVRWVARIRPDRKTHGNMLANLSCGTLAHVKGDHKVYLTESSLVPICNEAEQLVRAVQLLYKDQVGLISSGKFGCKKEDCYCRTEEAIDRFWWSRNVLR